MVGLKVVPDVVAAGQAECATRKDIHTSPAGHPTCSSMRAAIHNRRRSQVEKSIPTIYVDSLDTSLNSFYNNVRRVKSRIVKPSRHSIYVLANKASSTDRPARVGKNFWHELLHISIGHKLMPDCSRGYHCRVRNKNSYPGQQQLQPL
jgi:hypothetical protein